LYQNDIIKEVTAIAVFLKKESLPFEKVIININVSF